MSNSDDENSPRLRQDKFERKDKENTSAGMIAGVIIVIIGLIGIYLYYTYEVVPSAVVEPTTQPTIVTPVSTEQTNPPANNQTNTVPENNQNNTVPVPATN